MGMDADVYQQQALKTAGEFADKTEQLVFSQAGLHSEGGEFANRVYKHVWQGHPLDHKKTIEELGDALWFVACAADALGVTLSDVMRANNLKLALRYRSGGFSVDESLARIDHLGQDPGEVEYRAEQEWLEHQRATANEVATQLRLPKEVTDGSSDTPQRGEQAVHRSTDTGERASAARRPRRRATVAEHRKRHVEDA